MQKHYNDLPPLPSVVLYQPLIPQNTGNIARLTAANSTKLHLIEPLGFELTDKYLKRAGLDYWSEVQLTVHPSWSAFMEATNTAPKDIVLLTKHATQTIFDFQFTSATVLVFGNESQGLPREIHDNFPEQRLSIPMRNQNVRSLNLAGSASIVLYEAMRQLRETATRDSYARQLDSTAKRNG